MPQLDLPLDQLTTYQGRNPCPADLDAFWEAGLAEMRALDPRVELTPAAFQVPGAECFDLWFTGTGGARLHAKYLRPAGGGGKRPCMLLFHGYTGNAGGWFEKLAWVQQGYCVAALDCRGQGGQSTDPGGVAGNTHNGHIIRGLDGSSPHQLYYRHVFLDTALLARVVSTLPEVDGDRLGASGWSQGGALTLACAALEPRIRRIAPVYPFLCDYRRVWEMDLAKDAYAELRTYFRNFDPRHEREAAIFERLGYIDCQHLAKRIRADVLLTVGLMDPICPPSTQFAAYNKITARKELLIYPDFGHEGLPDAHERIALFMRGL
jgi:cephalosporin-C deacetylase